MPSGPPDSKRRRQLLRTAFLARNCEWAIRLLVLSGRIHGPVHSSLGHEWIAAVFSTVLRASDWVYPYYRWHSWFLARSGNAAIFLERLRAADLRGEAMHVGDPARRLAGANAYVAQHLPIAAGHAWSQAESLQRGVVLASVGEGALASGLVLESLSLARRTRAPMLLCVEDNGVQNYGVTNRAEAVSAEALASAARIPFLRFAIGNSETAGLESVAEFVHSVRETRVPGMVLCDTILEHPHSIGPKDQFVSAIPNWIEPESVPSQRVEELGLALGVSTHEQEMLLREAGVEVEAAVERVFGCALSWREAWLR